MSEQKNKIDNTFATKVARTGSRSNSGFKNSSRCNKHHGKRGNITSKNPFKKRMLCTDHAAHKWGFEHICCSKGARCGFAHSIAQQIVDPENHRFNKIIRNAVNKSDSTEVSKLDLMDPEIFNHLAKRSKICKRFLSCYDKKSKGTLKKSDICPGGANCKGGICGDSYDFDFTKSLLLDEGDWRYGKPNGVGICLTKYGLIPLVIQKQKAAEKEALAKAEAEEKRVTQMLTNKDIFPTLSSGVSKDTSDSSNSWDKSKDWEETSNEADRIKQRFGEEIIIHKGKTYRYTLKKGQEMKIIHDRPHIVEPMYEPKASLRVTGYPRLYNMSSITSDEDREYWKSHPLLVPRISQRQYDYDDECYSEEEYYEEEEEYYEDEEEYEHEEEYDDWEDILD